MTYKEVRLLGADGQLRVLGMTGDEPTVLAAAALAEPVPFDSRAVPRLATADGDWTVHGSQGCGCRSVLKRMDRGTALQIAGLA